MSKHDIVKRAPKDFYCNVCRQSWQQESKAPCPGVPVYAYGAWGDLVTKNQLRGKGYSAGKKSLPSPVGCYRGMEDYVMLYDVKDATPKRASTRINTTYYLETVCWPKSMFPILDYFTGTQWDVDQILSGDDMAWTRFEVAELAIHLGCFESSETGDCAVLKLKPPMNVHKRYRQWGNNESHKLSERVIRAYQQWQIDNRPRLTDEQIAALDAKREAYAQEQARLDAERRAKLFDFPRTLVDHGEETPVQKGMFE